MIVSESDARQEIHQSMVSRSPAGSVGDLGRLGPSFPRDRKQDWVTYRSEVTAFQLLNGLPVS